MTASERRLWAPLRRMDLNIRRQAPVGRYVADFIQHEAKLVIEIDGPLHAWADIQHRDAERDAWFAEQGYRVLRFPDRRAFECPDDVAAEIAMQIEVRCGGKRRSHPHPCPSPIKGEGS